MYTYIYILNTYHDILYCIIYEPSPKKQNINHIIIHPYFAHVPKKR